MAENEAVKAAEEMAKKEPLDIAPTMEMARPLDSVVKAAARLSDAISKANFWGEWEEEREEIVELNTKLRVRLLNAIALWNGVTRCACGKPRSEHTPDSGCVELFLKSDAKGEATR